MTILTLNAGSSSMKLALFDRAGGRVASGVVEGVGGAGRMAVRDRDGEVASRAVDAATHAAALEAVLSALDRDPASIEAVGHRIVHGGPGRDRPAILDATTMAALEALSPLAPLHQPHNLAGVRDAARRFPRALQVGAFDTAFHQGKPWVHDAYAIPRPLYDAGVRRYGFHGLSYEAVARRLAAEHPSLAAGRVVAAHLGNGASVCAMRAGRSVACSMGFSTAGGLAMGTRAGGIDPGVLLWLMRERGMDADAIERLIYRESGMLALSGVSHDLRAITAAGTPEAEQALDYYAVRVAEEVARMVVVLGGIDAMVFTGGVGENAAGIRASVIDKLAPLGLGRPDGAAVLTVAADEEGAIARAARGALAARAPNA